MNHDSNIPGIRVLDEDMKIYTNVLQIGLPAVPQTV